MRNSLLLLALFIGSFIYGQEGKAETVKKTFSRTTTISQSIDAEPASVWMILTNASEYARWNSTIVSIEGDIALDEKIALTSTLDTSRTFKLKVTESVDNERLVWGDALGERTYTLTENGDGTLFTMTEKIGGFMFPLFANKIPSFDDSFEQFAADLKTEAESNK